MPIIKSAKDKLKKDKKKTKINAKSMAKMKKTLQALRKNTDKKKISELLARAFSEIDKASKKKVIHKNKAKRLKSRISRQAKKT